jgi:hypothetical protein
MVTAADRRPFVRFLARWSESAHLLESRAFGCLAASKLRPSDVCHGVPMDVTGAQEIRPDQVLREKALVTGSSRLRCKGNGRTDVRVNVAKLIGPLEGQEWISATVEDRLDAHGVEVEEVGAGIVQVLLAQPLRPLLPYVLDPKLDTEVRPIGTPNLGMVDAVRLDDDRQTVIVGDVDSGVPNRVDDVSCSLNDRIADEQAWPNHGRFMQHVNNVVRDLRATGPHPVFDPGKRSTRTIQALLQQEPGGLVGSSTHRLGGGPLVPRHEAVSPNPLLGLVTW